MDSQSLDNHQTDELQHNLIYPTRTSELTLEQRVLRLRHIRQMRIVALGDSSVYGVGDFDDQSETVGAGWSGRFAHDVRAARFVNLGKNGSRFRSVVKSQLDGALSMSPDIALLCIGTNDVLRGDFSLQEISDAAIHIIKKFSQAESLVVFLGIPDPIKTAPGPMALKKILHRRVNALNWVLAEVCNQYGGVFIDTWDHSMATDRSMWHIDRMHPSAKGHQEIADLVRRSLFLPRRSRKKLPVGRENINRRDEIFWLFTNGLKWFAKRSIDLVPALLWLMVSSKFKDSQLEAR